MRGGIVRVTAVKTVGGRSRRVHLGLDAGPHATEALCPIARPFRTTAIHAANCGACIARARALGLNIEGLVAIPERLRILINSVRTQSPEAERFTNTELAALLRSCRTAAGALRKLRSHFT